MHARCGTPDSCVLLASEGDIFLQPPLWLGVVLMNYDDDDEPERDRMVDSRHDKSWPTPGHILCVLAASTHAWQLGDDLS